MLSSMKDMRVARARNASGNYFPPGIPKLNMNPVSELQLSPGDYQPEEAKGGVTAAAALEGKHAHGIPKRVSGVSDGCIHPHIAGAIPSMKASKSSPYPETSDTNGLMR